MRYVFVLIVLLAPLTARAQGLAVFAAASLTEALQEISADWARTGHAPPRLSFGSSSVLARQIEQGAPANLFLSADEKWMDYLAARDLLAPGTRTNLLGNELVLIMPNDTARPIAIKPGFDLAGLIGPAGRLALGDPAHVPVGIYAEQALRKLDVWPLVSPRLAGTDTVRSTLMLVERGEAAVGIVYTTDAIAAAGVTIVGTFPADSHDPITYPFAITKLGDTAEARSLLTFMSGPEARAVFLWRDFKIE